MGSDYVDVDKFIEAFLDGYSDATRGQYRTSLKTLRKYTDRMGISLFQVTPVDIDRYFKEISKTLSPGTVRSRHACLAMFYEFAVTKQAIDGPSPIAGRERPKTENFRAPSGLTLADFQSILSTLERSPDRIAVVTMLMLLGGVRVNELTRLDVTDVSFQDDLTVLAVNGRTITLPPLITKRLRPLVEGRTSGPLVESASGARYTRHNLGKVLERIGRRAGISKRIGPLTLQTLMYETALASGVDPWDLAEAVGAKSWRGFVNLGPGGTPRDKHPAFHILRRLSDPGPLGDLQHQVDSLLGDPDIHPVAPIVVAGALLEARLRTMVQNAGLIISGNPTLNSYIEALRQGKEITDVEWHELKALATRRNQAAHGRDLPSLTRKDAEKMAQGVAEFLQKHL